MSMMVKLQEIRNEFDEELVIKVTRAFSDLADLEGRLPVNKIEDLVIKLDEYFNEEELNQVIFEADPLRRGYVWFADLKPLFMRLQGAVISAEELLSEFKMFDVDDDGYVTLEDLKRELGDEVTTEDIELLLKAVDLDGDGRIDFEEFEFLFL